MRHRLRQRRGGEVAFRVEHPDRAALHGLTLPSGIAVDTTGAVYVTDHESGKVVKLDPGRAT
ncbi:hypothetical protein BB737_27835 [Mycobacterium avium subsp. hominissuis]|nr:hypothetical protein CKJ58_25920 [Mycobacterium intracellulare subsp. chimaera]PBA61254.1 hypothetical protein CKJ56_12890 [Mycobacterium intracellulare subsp. chimaera]PBJ59762.1 hypothetical protein BB737_27835 [Mycobacterium avium subsp. hominissuis]